MTLKVVYHLSDRPPDRCQSSPISMVSDSGWKLKQTDSAYMIGEAIGRGITVARVRQTFSAR